ncbi:hypothetical protein ASE95_15045 [Sphingomonas sp. Leaf231]|uniref:hypothetical protein n=1 Tax=Sphingomonas sp. Leaf231 TaxID=1736301 RepID=UPI0006F47571|nr:hypothetical protein [Sphingomonas sp. Leaf231]KQN90030.1 hypothetical protein ASE95_15045 [Sphingomonas sp. Leaf231]
MTTAQITSMVLIVLCIGVMFQSARLTWLLRQMRPSEFAKIIAPIDQSTAASRRVLDDLLRSLAAESEEQAAMIEKSLKMRRELDALCEEMTIIIGVGDSLADRITGAVNAAAAAATPAEAHAAADPHEPSTVDRDEPRKVGVAA